MLDAESEQILRQLTQIKADFERQKKVVSDFERERELAAGANLSVHAFDALDILVSTISEQANFTYVNPSWLAFTGRSSEQLMGSNWKLLIHPADLAQVERAIHEGTRSKDKFSFELRLMCQSGEYRWVSMNFQPRLSDDHTLITHVTTTLDVSKRRSAEERLILIAEGSELGFWDLDLATGLLAINEIWGSLLGFDILDCTPSLNWWRKLIHPDESESTFDALRAHIDGKSTTFEREVRLKHSDGSWRWFLLKGRVVGWATKGHARRVAGTLMDINDRVQLQREQHRFQTKMQEAQKLESIGVLAGGIAHDFNNLLMGILGNADLAIAKSPKDTEIRTCLDAIVKASTRAAELCRELLAYSGKGRFIVEPVQLNEVIRDMYNLLDVTINKNVDVNFELADKVPAVEADVTQLRQVIMNLLTNASEAIGSFHGAIHIKTWAKFMSEEDLLNKFPTDELSSGFYVYMRVKDTGAGMEPATIARIYDPFYTTKAHGRGLGMASVRGIVRSHKGAISVDSTPGKGTEFTLLFPASELEASVQEVEVELETTLDGGLILLVEDEQLVSDVTAMMLRQHGFHIMTASNGVQAVELFKTHHSEVTLTLLDLAMPIMGGEDALKRLVAIDPDIKVLLTSGYNEHDTINEFTRETISGFIQKPYKANQLIREMKRILGS